MSAVGGYFELELYAGKEFHSTAIKLNTGRNAFEYILRVKEYEKIYIPYFTCDVLLEPLIKLKLKYEFYTIDQNFEPIFNFDILKNDDAFLYTNYFGLKDEYIKQLKYKNIIIDNAQSFFSLPINGFDTFYSPRKFFGITDGAYLYTNKLIQVPLERDYSSTRFEHLLKRIDESAEIGYNLFAKNEAALSNQPIKIMSLITHKILSSINYDFIKERRIDNFNYLHSNLKSINKIPINLSELSVPLTYPFYCADASVRKKLTTVKIYTPQYWPNVLKMVSEKSIEYDYATHILHLPIDQRINYLQLDTIIKYIKHEY